MLKLRWPGHQQAAIDYCQDRFDQVFGHLFRDRTGTLPPGIDHHENRHGRVRFEFVNGGQIDAVELQVWTDMAKRWVRTTAPQGYTILEDDDTVPDLSGIERHYDLPARIAVTCDDRGTRTTVTNHHGETRRYNREVDLSELKGGYLPDDHVADHTEETL